MARAFSEIAFTESVKTLQSGMAVARPIKNLS